MSTVYFLDDSYKVPHVAAPLQAEPNTVWILNPIGLEEWIYGTNKTPAAVLPHDHGERRGEPTKEPFWFCSFGPQAPEGGAPNSWLFGLPLYPASVPFNFITQPKCLGWWPFRIPGQVKTFALEYLIFMNGAALRTVTLKARIRPYSDVGLNHDQGNGPSATVINTHTAGADRVTRDQFVFSDLSALGDLGLDKENLVLEIWIVDNLSSGTLYRLIAGAAVALTYGVGVNEPIENSPSRAEVIPSEIKTGEIVLSDTAQRAHLRYNEVILAALGFAPGLQSNLNTEREQDDYQQTIYQPHQHRGRRYLDPVSGLAVYDGAVQRRILWQIAPLSNQGDTVADQTDQPGQGQKIHSGGTLATQVEFKGRLSLPAGQQAIFLRFGIKPGTGAELARVYCYVALTDIEGNTIDISVNSQGFREASAKAGAFSVVDVHPVESPLWQSNNIRLNQGLGLWTEDAAKSPNPSNALTLARIPRVSKLVTIAFNLSKVDYPYMLRCKWALETGARASGVFASNARFAFAVASVPAGY